MFVLVVYYADELRQIDDDAVLVDSRVQTHTAGLSDEWRSCRYCPLDLGSVSGAGNIKSRGSR